MKYISADNDFRAPWQGRSECRQVLSSIRTVGTKNNIRLERLKDTAAGVYKKLLLISDRMDKICSKTCVGCKDVCCIRARVWYDFKDLLYLYFGSQKYPEAQIDRIRQDNKIKACSLLTKSGCLIPRTERPFICTWYMCPDQKKCLEKILPGSGNKMDKDIIRIKEMRNLLEEQFISMSTAL